MSANSDCLRFVRLSPAACAPVRASSGSAGYDLFAAEEISIAPGSRACIRTDLQLALPPGCYGRIAPRSGLALRAGIDVGGGVVDADYRGEVGILLINDATEPFTVSVGDRVAQLVVEEGAGAQPHPKLLQELASIVPTG